MDPFGDVRNCSQAILVDLCRTLFEVEQCNYKALDAAVDDWLDFVHTESLLIQHSLEDRVDDVSQRCRVAERLGFLEIALKESLSLARGSVVDHGGGHEDLGLDYDHVCILHIFFAVVARGDRESEVVLLRVGTDHPNNVSSVDPELLSPVADCNEPKLDIAVRLAILPIIVSVLDEAEQKSHVRARLARFRLDTE